MCDNGSHFQRQVLTNISSVIKPSKLTNGKLAEKESKSFKTCYNGINQDKIFNGFT